MISDRDIPLALAELYAPGLSVETLVERTFALTSRLFPFALNSHGVIDEATGVLSAHFDCALPGLDEAFAAFGRHMGKHAPFRFDPLFNAGKPFSARDVYSQAAFNDLDIFQDVYRPMRFVDHCFMHVPSGPGAIVFVGFLRDGRPFDADEKDLLRAVQPHLANGRALAQAITTGKGLPLSPQLFTRVGFTSRESEALFWLCQGKATADIAKLLGVRADSTRRLIRSVYVKLGVRHRGAATVRAIEVARRLVETPTFPGVILQTPTR